MKRNYDDPLYKKWRYQVRKRDKNECLVCGSKKRLQAHHIIPWATNASLRYDVNNGATLCYNCHNKVTKNEAKYAKLLNILINCNKDEK